MDEVELDELDISMRTVNRLAAAGIKTLAQLRRMSESDLRAIEGIGDRSIEELRPYLGDMH
jgi:DNA-directed RNA polymerase alpha subunit